MTFSQPTYTKNFKEKLKTYILLVKTVRFIKKIVFKFSKFFFHFLLIKYFFNSSFVKQIIYYSSNEKYIFYQNKKYVLLLLKSDLIISKNFLLNDSYPDVTSKKLHKIKYLFRKNKFNIDQIIDVGASLGNVIVPALKNKYFKYAIAIEPSNTFELLKKNVYLNNLEKFVDTYQIAITSRNDVEVKFENDPRDIGDNRVRFRKYKGLFNEDTRVLTKVKTKTLDFLLKNKDLSKSFLWLNNQGSETETLLGASKILKKFDLPIMLEFCPYFFKINNNFKKFLTVVSHLDKSVYLLDKNKFLGKSTKILFEGLYKSLGERGNYNYLLLI